MTKQTGILPIKVLLATILVLTLLQDVSLAGVFSCKECFMDSKVVNTNFEKLYWNEFQQDTPPRIKRYLQQEIVYQWNYTNYWYDTNGYNHDGYCGAITASPDGVNDGHENRTINWTETLNWARNMSVGECDQVFNPCSYPLISVTGTDYWYYISTDTRTTFNDVGCEMSGYSLSHYQYSFDEGRQAIAVTNVPSFTTNYWIGTDTNETRTDCTGSGNHYCEPGTNGPNETIITNRFYDQLSGSITNQTQTIRQYEYKYTNYRINETVILTNEYTDNMLISDVLSRLPLDYLDWHSGSDAAYFRWMANNWEGVVPENHLVGEGQKMKYRFKIPDSKTNETYRIRWKEVTTYTNGSTSFVKKREDVVGIGNPTNYAYSSEHEIPMPTNECTITVDFVRVKILPNPPPPPGTGHASGGH